MADLNEKQMQERLTLCDAWNIGYNNGGKLSPLAHVFFANFIVHRHPDLILSKEESALVATMLPIVPEDLSKDIEAHLPKASSETGVHRNMLRAVAHGIATRNAGKNREAAILVRESVQAISAAIEADAH
jgi:hypothetical protein